MNEFDKILLPIERTLDVTALQVRAIAQNIANANTPGYRRVDASFADLIEAAKKPAGMERMRAYRSVRPELEVDESAPIASNGNSVDTDFELALLQKVALRYELATRMVNGKLSSMRMAINGHT